MRVAETNKLELLKWAREEKQCKWDEWTIQAAARQGNLEMVKYCVANECPINGLRVDALPQKVISRYSNTYTKKRKRLGMVWTASWAAENGHLHILEYLVERKYDKYYETACGVAAENGHLDCLKYLHETAKAPWDDWRRTRSAREQPHRVFTIPPRERLSSPTRLAIRTWSVTHLIKTHTKRREAKGAKEF